MPLKEDLVFLLLGLRMQALTREQVAACGAELARRGSGRIGDVLREKGYLDEATRGALALLAGKQIEQAGGDAGKCLASLGADEETQRWLAGAEGFAEAPRTVLEWKAETLPPPGAGTLERAREALGRAAETVGEAAAEGGPVAGGAQEERPAAGSRYAFREELGRGGLGRVVRAVDRDFGRDVAVKMMRPGLSDAQAVERFLLEARAAGRLSHPNIVPVHEIGVLRSGEEEAPYFTMTRIVGRDLGRILEAYERGEEKTRARFNRHRLLRIFQEVCNAISYAHDHGVIHRDLKPANVMVGEYGEVYVVDWGLAKMQGKPDSPDQGGSVDRPDGFPDVHGKQAPGDLTAPLTVDGDVLGTPAYMPPEQATGRVSEIDERSDIYSLGAILYEILTLRPPFEGATVLDVIRKVVTAEVTLPSARVSEIRKDLSNERRKETDAGAGGPSSPGGDPRVGTSDPASADDPQAPAFLEGVPPELDEVVLKALSKDKGRRFASARALGEEIQRFLEGEKERERNRARAMAKVASGRIRVERMEALRAGLKAGQKEVEERFGEIETWWPVERKKGFWALQDRVKKLRDDLVRTYAEAQEAFQEALGFERKNTEARAALADLYWDRFLIEEEAGNRSEALLYVNLVRQYNDGQYDARLKGDGTLAISTKRYPCPCLTEGKTIEPGEMELMGYHPFSGRALDLPAPGGREAAARQAGGRKGAEGLPDLEPKEPVRLKVHGPACRTEPLEGAAVWLFRYVEKNRILVPVFPSGIDVGGGAAHGLPPTDVLDLLFDPGSPFRPEEGLYLGKTPIPPFRIPMGSYLLIIAFRKEGSPGGRGGGPSAWAPVRVPVFIGRNIDENVAATLFREDEIPTGFVQVPGGPFIYQGDKENPFSEAREIRETDDFFLAKFPVTCRDYLAFLNELAREDPGEAEKRAPREPGKARPYWPRTEDGTYVIPTKAWLAEAPESLAKEARRLVSSPVDWEEDWPVSGISWKDAMVFGSWFRRKCGVPAHLPHEVLWEKAARGVDGRYYVFGNHFDHTWANTMDSHEGPPRPCRVDAFPADESVFGARGLGGNAQDWCLNEVENGRRRLLRGGSWLVAGTIVRAADRRASVPSFIPHHFSFRLLVPASIGSGAVEE